MQALSPILMMLLMFAVFYFILIRPQVRRQREQQDMLKKLDKGDTILTRGGLIGKITGTAGDVLVVELQEKVRVRIPRPTRPTRPRGPTRTRKRLRLRSRNGNGLG
jgi:preprotein translocase subunit YajC